jgi:exopolysaccharide biosynthesis polyprenyl glycosylphosphotransferase
MIDYRVRGVTVLHSIATAAAAFVVFWLWVPLFFGVLRSQSPASYLRYLEYSTVLVFGVCVNYVVAKWNRLDLLQLDFLGALRLSIRQTITLFAVVAIYLFSRRDGTMSRLFFFSAIPLLCAVFVILNAKLPRFLASRMFHVRRRQRTILVGSPTQAARIATWLRNKARYGLDVVGIITDDTDRTKILDWPNLGGLDDLETILAATGATQIISLYLPNSLPRAARFGKECEKLGVRLMFVNDIEHRFSHCVHFFEDSGVRLVSLREEPLECPFNRILKRVLDIAVALPVVIFLLPPVSLFVMLVHRWQSPGPLFFRQRRSGFQNAPFEIIKFRTMDVANPDEAAQATKDDPRIFPLGRWLRRLSLDELPQFINVLRADMSVVGPRPHMIEHDGEFAKSAQAYRIRAFVRPGITGLAQVSGFRGEARHVKDVIDRVRSDVYYLEHWSFGLDWMIILRTGWQFLRPSRNAY